MVTATILEPVRILASQSKEHGGQREDRLVVEDTRGQRIG